MSATVTSEISAAGAPAAAVSAAAERERPADSCPTALLGWVLRRCPGRRPWRMVKTDPRKEIMMDTKIGVVVGVDGSDSALRAVRWAADDTIRRHEPLRLVAAACPGQMETR